MLAHSGSRVVFCEDAAQLAKIDSVRRGCPTSSTASSSTARRRGRSPWTPCASAGARWTSRSPPRAPRPCGPTTWPRSSTPRARPGRPRAACSRTPTCWPRSTAAGTGWSWTARWSPTSSCHSHTSLARVTQMVVLTSVGPSSTGAATPSRSWPSWPRRARRTSPRSRASSRRSTPRVLGDVEEQGRLQAGDLRLGAGGGPAGAGSRRAGKPAGRSRAGVTPSPTAWCSSKVRGVFGDSLHVAITGAAPISADIIEFFDACGVLVLEGYGLTETCAASTLNTPSRAAHRHRRTAAARHRGARRRRRRAAAARAARLRGLLPQRRGDEREPRRRLAAHRRPRLRRRRRLRAHHRAQEGAHHHLERQEHLADQHRGAPARDAAGSRRRSSFGDNKPYLVALLTLDPDEARQARRARGRRPATRRARGPPGGPRRAAGRASTRSTSGSRASSRSSASRSSTATSASPTGELTPTLKIKRGVVAERYGDRVEELYA